MKSEQLLEKIKQGENEFFELKEDARDPLLLSKLISSFANNKGGQIIIGVRDGFEVVGTDTNRIIGVIERAKKTLKPIPNFNSEIVSLNNKSVLLINIEKSNEIIFFAGSVFQRIGEGIKPMTAESIKLKLTTISSDSNSLEILADAIKRQSQTIDELREEIKNSNSWKSKMRDNFISGFIGVILGLILTLFLTK